MSRWVFLLILTVAPKLKTLPDYKLSGSPSKSSLFSIDMPHNHPSQLWLKQLPCEPEQVSGKGTTEGLRTVRVCARPAMTVAPSHMQEVHAPLTHTHTKKKTSPNHNKRNRKKCTHILTCYFPPLNLNRVIKRRQRSIIQTAQVRDTELHPSHRAPTTAPHSELRAPAQPREQFTMASWHARGVP